MNLNELNVGRNTGDRGTATGTLKWNQPEAIHATTVSFGRGPNAIGILEVPTGGTFLLGTAGDAIDNLFIGFHDTSRGGASTAQADLDFTVTNPTFEAHIARNLTIGRISDSFGGTGDGSLTLASNSVLNLGTTASLAIWSYTRKLVMA